jgi:hypothetical protein
MRLDEQMTRPSDGMSGSESFLSVGSPRDRSFNCTFLLLRASSRRGRLWEGFGPLFAQVLAAGAVFEARDPHARIWIGTHIRRGTSGV